MRAAYLCALFLLAWLTQAPLVAADPELKAKQQQLRELQDAVQSVQKELADKRGKLGSTEKKFKRAEKQIGELGARLHELQQRRAELENELRELQRELAQTQQRQQAQREQLARYLRAAYTSGNRDVLSLLFSDASPADRARQLEYLRRVNRSRSAMLDNYASLLDKQVELLATIEARRTANARNTKKIAAQQDQLREAQGKRTALLVKLQREIGDDDRQLGMLRASRQELQELVDSMSEALARAPLREQAAARPVGPLPGKFAAARGQLPWPVSAGTRLAFGRTDSVSGLKSRGVSIRAESGESVRAIYPGEIIFADWFGGQGLLAIVDHGDGYWSLYGHNQSLLKPVGTRVDAGEAIATVGNSGGHRHPALYFEIRHKGVPSDPATWCRK